MSLLEELVWSWDYCQAVTYKSYWNEINTADFRPHIAADKLLKVSASHWGMLEYLHEVYEEH